VLDGGAAGTLEGRGDGVSVADYDRDGFLDLFVTNSDITPPLLGPHQLFRNAGNSNHWLEIDLEGVQSNRDGIGARILVTTPDGVTQLREQSGGMHAYGQHHKRIHVGLGPNTIVEQIEVHWPSGIVQTASAINADQIVRLIEPEPVDIDTDGDGVPDSIDTDDDNDFLLDVHETNTGEFNSPTDTGTDPLVADSDGDGVNDGLEVEAGTNPNSNAEVPILHDGDVTNDGAVDAGDLTLAMRIVTGQISPTPFQIAKLDVAPLSGGSPSPDGQVNLGDYVVLVQKVTGSVSF
jgi:hypothetical protein